jgi:hypothetical protein
VITFNNYPALEVLFGVPKGTIQTLEDWHAAAPSKPLMITEWSFPALDAGLPSVHGAGMRVDTQAQKARCFKYFQAMLAGLDFVIGSDYFMFLDEPALGISAIFPEDSNYGLIDVNDHPWPELTAAATQINKQVCVRHHTGMMELLQWSHQPWLDGGGSVVTTFTGDARGLSVAITSGVIRISFNGQSLCALSGALVGTLSGATSDSWLALQDPSITTIRVDTNAVHYDIVFT